MLRREDIRARMVLFLQEKGQELLQEKGRKKIIFLLFLRKKRGSARSAVPIKKAREGDERFGCRGNRNIKQEVVDVFQKKVKENDRWAPRATRLFVSSTS